METDRGDASNCSSGMFGRPHSRDGYGCRNHQCLTLLRDTDPVKSTTTTEIRMRKKVLQQSISLQGMLAFRAIGPADVAATPAIEDCHWKTLRKLHHRRQNSIAF